MPRVHGVNERVANGDYAMSGIFARLLKRMDRLPP
jgi:hypothetical protein